MAVSGAVVSCAANDWTLVASGVSKIGGIFPRNPNARLFLCPTSANQRPGNSANLTPNLPYAPLTGPSNSVFQDDGATYWWIWTAQAVDVVVWKL